MENLSEKVTAVFMDCLYRDGEVGGSPEVPKDAVIVEGIMGKFGFHPERLESHREDVRGFLNEMPAMFHKDTGGGWTFLNLCNDKNNEQWTGFHRTMEQLVVLGLGLKMASYCMPRDMWKMFPGGMPYVMFDTKGDLNVQPQESHSG
jgi:hypothetical protein